MAAYFGSAHAAAPASANGNWSEFGSVPSGGRFNPAEHILNTTNVATLKVLWSTSDGSFPLTAPAVVDGVVYSGTNAFEAATGKLLWATNAFGISPAVSKGKVYIDSFSGLCAYAAAAGTNLWCAGTSYLPDAPSGAAVVDGIAYFGSAVGSVFAIDAATGEQLWSAPISADNAASSPAVANGVVYVGSDDGTLYAFDAKTGAELAAVAGVAGQSSPTVANGVVYSETTESGELFALGVDANEAGRANAP
jgi:outer membrane protein assembly factor BamB